MGDVNILDVLFRLIHVGTAIVLVGGSVFMRFVLMPASKKLPDDAHENLRASVLGTWKKFVHAGIALLLISGFYNYIFVMIPLHKGDGLYHGMVGTKILLAFAIFFIASALVGRSSAFAKMRENRKKWLGVIVVLTAIVVAISGFVKVRGVPVTPAAEIEEVNEEPTSD